MVKLILAAVLFCLALVACSRKPEASGPERHYQLSGRVVALDVKHQSATIDAAAIPNFMEAMTMEYPVKSKAEFSALRVGDKITASLDVSAAGDTYKLSSIQKQNTQSTGK